MSRSPGGRQPVNSLTGLAEVTSEGMELIQLVDDSDEVMDESSAESEGPVFVCCFCLDQFDSHEMVNTHQGVCPKRFKESRQGNSSQKAAKVVRSSLAAVESSETITSLGRKATVSFAPFSSTLKTRRQRKLDRIIDKRNARRLMQQECREMREVPKCGAWWVSRPVAASSSQQHPSKYMVESAFLLGLGLARTSDVKAMNISNVKVEQEVDLDCQIVSVEGPLSAVPAPAIVKPAFTSPRTRSLMSQLSRDGEANTRRRLSFCFVEDEWADREALNEGRDPLQMSLLTLAVSSPLGQRIKKYVKGEGHLNIVKDIEGHCKTEIDEDGYSKLRYRGCDFRVTFKKKKRASNYVHKYKFNRSEKLEFERLLQTGLTCHSRMLKERMDRCRVVLSRLSESEIKVWTEEKKITLSEQIVVDDDICITHIDIPVTKIAQGPAGDAFSPSRLHLNNRPIQNLGASPSHVQSRLGLTADCQRLTPRVSASPPHVPNIFRNRPSHVPSPPGPNNSFKVSTPNNNSHHQYLSPWSLTNHEQENCRSRSSALPASLDNRSYSRQSKLASSHLSGHASLSPSTYNTPLDKSTTNNVLRESVHDRSVHELSNSGDLASPVSRRKQLLTEVRRDDSDGDDLQIIAPPSERFIPLHRSAPSSSSTLPSSSRRFSAMQQLPRPPLISAQPPTRRLSNFDYFSIRDGKILSQNLSSTTSVTPSQHRASAATVIPDSGSPRQNCHRQSQASSNSVSHPHHHHHYQDNGYKVRSQLNGQNRPGIISPHKLNRRSGLALNGLASNNTSKTLVHRKRLPRFNNQEDDVLEIILIDDD